MPNSRMSLSAGIARSGKRPDGALLSRKPANGAMPANGSYSSAVLSMGSAVADLLRNPFRAGIPAWRWLRFKWRWWRWALSSSSELGDPSLGKTREERNRNIRLIGERWLSREPKWPRDG